MEKKRAKRNRKLLAVLLIVIVALASVGIWYYLAIFVPQYEEERARLLTLTTTTAPRDLDPALAYETSSNSIVINVFDRLVEYKRGTTEIEPSLATSWDIPDPKTYILDLRSDVKFHDGTTFDAASVKYSFERVITLGGPPSYLFAVVNEIVVLDNNKVKITLNQEFAPFLSILAHPVASIVSPSAVQKYGENFTKNPIGTGPFKLDYWQEGKELVLTANKDYFKGAPRLEKIVVKTILEASARKEALEKGELDIVFTCPPHIDPSDIADLENNPDIRTFKGVGASVEFLGFNLEKEPLSDPKVREAISYAIDYDEIIENAMGGRAERIGSPIAPDVFGYKDMPLRQRDVARAKQLLDQAGYSAGLDITLTYNLENLVRRKVAEVIRDSLRDVGITVIIKGLDFPSAIDEYINMRHQMFLNGWTPDYFDADSYLSPQFHSASRVPYGYNVFGFSNTEVDRLIDEGRSSTDPSVRLSAYHEVQDKIAEQLPCVFLFVSSVHDFARYNIEGWIHSPTELFDAYGLYKA